MTAQITRIEAQVYEMLKQGMGVYEMADKVKKTRQHISRCLSMLEETGLATHTIVSGRRSYTAVLGSYEIVNRKSLSHKKPLGATTNFKMLRDLARQYGSDNIRFIAYQMGKAHYQYLCQKVGVAESELRRIILKLEAVA